jgi:hypothetical protein
VSDLRSQSLIIIIIIIIIIMIDECCPSQLTGTTGCEEPIGMQTFSVVFGKHLS